MISREEIRAVSLQDAEYPRLLKTIQKPPEPLWVRGPGIDNDLFHLASIGSRFVDQETIKTLTAFLEKVCLTYSDVAQTPLVIVSGLAYGIDAASHEMGLMHAHTVGVLPTAINRMDPPKNLYLAQQILDERQPGSAIVSEYAPVQDDQRSPRNPLARNRITLGMSKALLVSGVSDEVSGSMATVNRARDEKRPIYFLAGTVSERIKTLLLGIYKAHEVQNPEQFVEQLVSLK